MNNKPFWLKKAEAYQQFFVSRRVSKCDHTDLVNYYIKNENIDIDSKDVDMWIEVSKCFFEKLKAKGETVISFFDSYWWGYKKPFHLYTDEQIRSQACIIQPISENKILREIKDEMDARNGGIKK